MREGEGEKEGREGKDAGGEGDNEGGRGGTLFKEARIFSPPQFCGCVQVEAQHLTAK